MIDYPLINGVRHDFSSINVRIGGASREIGLTAIDYADPLTPTMVMGNHAQTLGMTRGTQECSASIELLHSESEALIERLGDGYKEVFFDITVQYREAGSPASTHVLKGCRIKDDPRSHAQGGDALKVKIDLALLEIIRNGKRGVRSPLIGAGF